MPRKPFRIKSESFTMSINYISMKKYLLLSAVFLFTVLISLSAKTPKAPIVQKKAELTFNVSMHCKSCQEKIERNIPFEKGVKDLTVDLEKKTVKVVFDPRKTNEDKLKKAFEALDFVCEKAETPIVNPN